jgi:hypothetical protein
MAGYMGFWLAASEFLEDANKLRRDPPYAKTSSADSPTASQHHQQLPLMTVQPNTQTAILIYSAGRLAR